jgi:hypothetical protein
MEVEIIYSALHVKLHKQIHKNLFVYICNRPHQHHNVTKKVGNVTMSCFCHIQQIYTNRFLWDYSCSFTCKALYSLSFLEDSTPNMNKLFSYLHLLNARGPILLQLYFPQFWAHRYVYLSSGCFQQLFEGRQSPGMHNISALPCKGSTLWAKQFTQLYVPFGVTYKKIGTIQRRECDFGKPMIQQIFSNGGLLW